MCNDGPSADQQLLICPAGYQPPAPLPRSSPTVTVVSPAAGTTFPAGATVSFTTSGAPDSLSTVRADAAADACMSQYDFFLAPSALVNASAPAVPVTAPGLYPDARVAARRSGYTYLTSTISPFAYQDETAPCFGGAAPWWPMKTAFSLPADLEPGAYVVLVRKTVMWW